MPSFTAQTYDLAGDPHIDSRIGFTDNLLKIVGGRKARISLGNAMDVTWTLETVDRDHTVWVARPPTQLGARQGVMLGAKSTGPVMRGTKFMMAWYRRFSRSLPILKAAGTLGSRFSRIASLAPSAGYAQRKALGRHSDHGPVATFHRCQYRAAVEGQR
jgi:hypothetical protein